MAVTITVTVIGIKIYILLTLYINWLQKKINIISTSIFTSNTITKNATTSSKQINLIY